MTQPQHPRPLSALEMPRFSGPTTMMRLPEFTDASGLDAAFVGVPFDLGTSNRPGSRYGPRAIRLESALLRPYNLATGAAPFESLRVGDLGDVRLNPYNLLASVNMITERISEIAVAGCRPLIMGGDHTILLPHLRSLAQGGTRPLGLVHVDAHSDTLDELFGERITHGTPVRRAVEEGLVNPGRVVQIGLRSTGYTADQFTWGVERGFYVIRAEELWHRSATPLMASVCAHLGDGPVYVSFDIDALDACLAPGTGTPEIGGLTSIQALEIVRGMRGLDIVGCDLVEVCPAYDPAGVTAVAAARLLFELLCVLPGVRYDAQ